MNLLLDTHAFLWFIAGDSRLDSNAKQLIENPNNKNYLSIASIWEITIKSSIGKLTVPMPPSVLIREHVLGNDIALLPVTPEHFDVLHSLPFHHKDPFDRLLVAQSLCEDLSLVTRDRALVAYGVDLIWSIA